MLVMSLYNVIDRVFIGQIVGPDAIAGLAITFPVMNLSAALGVLIGVGAAARTSIMLGQGRKHDAELVLGNSLVLIVMNAVVYLSLFAIFLDPLLIAFGASAHTLPYARSFMQVILPGMLVMNICFSFNNIMRSSGYPVKAMVAMMIGAGVNLLLAPLFLYVFRWGIAGAAFATDISMSVSAFFVMRHFFLKSSTIRFRRGIYRLRWPIVRDIVNIGAAPSLVNAASCFINVILNRSLAMYGGDSAIAAAGVFVTFTSLLTMVTVGMSQGLQPIVGYNFGAGNLSRAWRAFLLASSCATVITTIGWVLGLTIPGSIARLFTTDQALIDAVCTALPNSMWAFFVVGFQVMATTMFQSIGQAGKSIFMSLTRQVIFLIPLLLLLPRRYGLEGVWYSFGTSDVAATIVALSLIVWQYHSLRRASATPIAEPS